MLSEQGVDSTSQAEFEFKELPSPKGVDSFYLKQNGTLPSYNSVRNNSMDNFYRACDCGALKDAKKIIEKMSDKKKLINSRDRFGWTPLMMAVSSNNPSMVEWLLNNGAKESLDRVDLSGRSAFDLAVYYNFVDIVTLLSDALSKSKDEFVVSKHAVDSHLKMFCNICSVEYTGNDHSSSISHNINLSKIQPYVPFNYPNFKLGKSNIGYKMLKSSGWDTSSGLGKQKHGRLYPVRVHSKKDRSGLGFKLPDKSVNEKQSMSASKQSKFSSRNFRRSFHDESS